MEPDSIDEALGAAERSLGAGEGVAGTGFRQAVAAVKRDPILAARYADRMAAIDRAAFERWALFTVPIGVGTFLMVTATLIGIGLVAAAYYTEPEMLAVILFYVGVGVLLVTTHGLGHLAVGRLGRIRFTHWFIGTIARPQPGVKVDYSTYLRAPANVRAWMHASGAIVTKAVPLVLIGAAVAAGLPVWAVWGLPLITLVALVTDVVWSTKSSDWAKFIRERSFAQTS